jgi:rare lipoprotein A
MRPHSQLRARRAMAVVGVPATVLALGLFPALASSDTPTSAVAPASVSSGPVASAARATVTIRRHRLNVVAGRKVLVTGTVLPRGRGHVVALQRFAHGHWRTVDRAQTNHAGHFRLSRRMDRTGTARVRVRVHRDAQVTGGGRALGHLNVFRRVVVSWYGPGFFGGPLACGGSLGAGTMGVANKTLPCGTRVTLRYRGHTVRVRVIDRGPYVGGREYDLTSATRTALHFGGVGVVLATK